jgi:hypothetical protein
MLLGRQSYLDGTSLAERQELANLMAKIRKCCVVRISEKVLLGIHSFTWICKIS